MPKFYNFLFNDFEIELISDMMNNDASKWPDIN